MKRTKLFVISGIIGMCALGFGLNVSASSPSVIALEDTTTQTTQDTTTYTSDASSTNESTTMNPDSNTHENCDGVHANGECPYGYEGGSGMTSHHGKGQGSGNGLHDGSHAHQQLHDGSGHTNRGTHHTEIFE